MAEDEKKPRMVVTSTFYFPGHRGGGTPTSLHHLFDKLKMQYEIFLITGDREPGNTHPYKNVLFDQWIVQDGINVRYVSRKIRSLSGLAAIFHSLHPINLLYLNSFFSPVFTIWVLILRWFGQIGKEIPLVIAPRGEFGVGALRVKKWKKTLFRHAAFLLGLYSDVYWQASSEFEAKDITRAIGELDRISIAGDLCGSMPQAVFPRPPKTKGKAKLVFLSRIAPVKNLTVLLSLLSRVRGEVDFAIYGPIEDSLYWQECNRIIVSLPADKTVHYYGMVSRENVRKTLHEYDFFVLPTQGENYGHVIFEALSTGCPVLISDRTPWQSILQDGAGWVFSLDSMEPFIDAIQQMVGMSEEEYIIMSKSAIKHAVQHCNLADGAFVNHLELFSRARRIENREILQCIQAT